MNKLNPSRVGLVAGSFFGLIHLGWSILIAVGIAQPVVDFVFKMHFIEPIISIGNFDIMTAVILVMMTFVIGYVGGAILAALWNYLNR